MDEVTGEVPGEKGYGWSIGDEGEAVDGGVEMEEWKRRGGRRGGGGVGGWTKTARDSRLAGHQTPLRSDWRPRLRLWPINHYFVKMTSHSYPFSFIEQKI